MIRTLGLMLLLTVLAVGCANPAASLPVMGESSALPQSKVDTGVKLARIQEREGHLHKALEMYESLQQADPKNAEICHRLMVVHSRMDNPAKADEFFRKADELRPNHAELHADYGYACYLRGDLDAAQTHLQTAHNLRPSEDRITGNYALVLAAQGQTKASLTLYRKFLSEAEAHANVAYALTQRGDFNAAREHYSRALELDPKLKSAQHALLQLAEWEQAAKKKKAHSTSSQSADQKTNWQPAAKVSVRT